MTSIRSAKESPTDVAASMGRMSKSLAADGTKALYHVCKEGESQNAPHGSEVIVSKTIKQLIWAEQHKRKLFVYAICQFKGRTYPDLRTCRLERDTGIWKHDGGGCTIPPESLETLLKAIKDFAAGDRPASANDSENALKQA